MQCNDIFNDFLDDFIEGRLPTETAKDITDHLAVCNQCRQRCGQLKSFRDALRGFPELNKQVVIPEDIDHSIHQKILEMAAERRTKRIVKKPRYFITTLASAAVILVALVGYMLFQPAGIPASLLYAMEEDHQLFVKGDVKIDRETTVPEELSGYFRQNNLLSMKQCCCSLLCYNQNIQLKGGRIGGKDQCPCAAIYAYYNNIPVSFFIWDRAIPGVDTKGKITLGRTGEYNAAMKQIGERTIGVIAKLDKNQVAKLLEDIKTLNSCNCGCR
ncbi:MAG: hypothetical protein WC980_04485 [Candidatus Brocadiia bacterium]